MRIIGLIVIGLALASCATPYAANGLLGGYSETALAEDVYRITFKGNAYTSAERVQDFALMRAAELTIEKGYSHFVLLDAASGGRPYSIVTPGQSTTTGTATAYGNTATYSGSTTYTPPVVYSMFKPETGLIIKLANGKPDSVFSFDAAFLTRSMKEKYKIK